ERDVEALVAVVTGLLGEIELGELDAGDVAEADGQLRRRSGGGHRDRGSSRAPRGRRRGRRRSRLSARRDEERGDDTGDENSTEGQRAHATSWGWATGRRPAGVRGRRQRDTGRFQEGRS